MTRLLIPATGFAADIAANYCMGTGSQVCTAIGVLIAVVGFSQSYAMQALANRLMSAEAESTG